MSVFRASRAGVSLTRRPRAPAPGGRAPTSALGSLVAATLAASALSSGGTAGAARTPASHPARGTPSGRPLSPLPSLPSLARARLEVGRDHLVVIQDVDLPRGTYQSGDLDLYVAFGSPGSPLAIDAHLLAVPDGALAPAEGDHGEPLTFDRSSHCGGAAHVFLGSPRMSGVVVHVTEPLFRKAVAPGGMAAVRVRSLLPLPPEDARTGHEIVIRLGAPLDTPITVGRLQVAVEPEAPPVTRAEAHLCGPEADPYPLAISVLGPAGVPLRAGAPQPGAVLDLAVMAPVAPVLAVRHASDDLCVRFWF